MKGKIAMSQKELSRLSIVNLVINGAMRLKEAAKRMGVSYRHSKRIKRAVIEKGPPGIIHGNREKNPWNKYEGKKRALITKLAVGKYAVCNDIHCWEKITSEEGITISREKIRQWRRAEGLPPKRKRRPPKHHRRRERRSQFGAMILWDGSPHRWFGTSKPPCCLLTAVDDATSNIVGALFIKSEGSLGYLRLLKQMVKKHGIPLLIYQDRHVSLVRSNDRWSLEEELRGKQDPTQVGAALESLGIRAIPANSPQAKGRIERCFGVLQDRLTAEMALARIKDMETANPWLQKVFIPTYNKRFGIAPKSGESVFRSHKGLDLDKLISFSYEAPVHNDNTVRLGDIIIDIPPGPDRRGYAKCKIIVRQLLDSSWRVYYHDNLIAKHPKTELIAPFRTRIRKKYYAKAKKEYTWIYLSSKTAASPKGTFLRGS